MKKLLSIILISATLLCLVACGDSQTTTTTTADTKESLLANAEEVSCEDIISEFGQNQVKGMQDYAGKVLHITYCKVDKITQEYAILIPEDRGNAEIRAFLTTDDLVKIELNQFISVVGRLAEEFAETDYADSEYPALKLENAFITQDRFDIAGKCGGKNRDYDAYNFARKLEDGSYSNVYYLAYFNSSVDTKNIKDGDCFTINAKLIDDFLSINYYDAVIVD